MVEHLEQSLLLEPTDVRNQGSEARPMVPVTDTPAGGAGSLNLNREQPEPHTSSGLQDRLLQAVEQAIIATDPDGRIAYWNEFAEGLYGWRKEEVLGRNILEITVPPDDRETGSTAMERLQSGESWSGEFRVQRRDGSVFSAWVTTSPIRDESGALVGFVGVSADITVLKAVEDRLRASETRFRTMFEQLPLSIQVFGPDGANLDVNPAWQRLWNATPADIAGYNILQDEVARAQGTMPFVERAFAGEAARIPLMRYDPAEIGRNGRPRWIDSYLYPIKDASGAVTEVVLVVHDITEQHEAESERSSLLARERQARTRAEKSQQRLEFLAEASRLLASSLDYQTTLDHVARLTVPFLADWCDIKVLDEDGTVRRVAITHSDPAKEALAYELDRKYPHDPNAPSGAPNVIRTGKMEVYVEIPDELLVRGAIDEEYLRITRELGLRSAVLAPLTVRGRTIGVMTLVYAESDRRYTEDEIALAEELARRAGAAVDNAMLFTEAQTAIERHETVEAKLTLLSAATGALIGALQLEQLLERILVLARQLVAADAYAIWRREPVTERWSIAASNGISQAYCAAASEALAHSTQMPDSPLVI
ncbi:MAG: PAS domain S-box protein, partial [Chloroflexi bacterium]|nr:PAS domain S-box protein [Chloroflexota bacterium]